MTDEVVNNEAGKTPEQQTAQTSQAEQTQADPKLDAQRESAHSAADRLSQPGGLEVEEMPESNELQNRLNKTKQSLQDISPIIAENDVGAAFGDNSSGLMDMFKEANLSPRHLRFCCGGVFVVLIFAGLIFGGIKFVNYLQDRPDNVDVVKDEVIDKPVEDVIYDTLDPTIYGNILIGEDVSEVDPTTVLGEGLGEELFSDDSLALMIVDFAEIFEAMQVNVQDMLDQSRDREETLKEYQTELNYLLYLGRQNLVLLEEENLEIKVAFDLAVEKKLEFEKNFFNDLRELDSYATVESLDAFIVSSQDGVELKAKYKARDKLMSYYTLLIGNMELRVTDIDLNEEALVKGIQVVNITGSDIDLIIDESEL